MMFLCNIILYLTSKKHGGLCVYNPCVFALGWWSVRSSMPAVKFSRNFSCNYIYLFTDLSKYVPSATSNVYFVNEKMKTRCKEIQNELLELN